MAKKTKSSDYEAVKVGGDPRKDGSGKNWLKVDPNARVDVTCLVEVEDIIACEQCAIWLDDGNSPVWVYLGPNDPAHDLKIDRRYRAFLPVLHEGEAKVWSMGKSAHIQLLDIADAGTELTGLELRIKRTGAGLSTRYSIVPKGDRKDVSKVEEVDVLSLLGPLTVEGVQELIAEKLGKDSYDDVLESYRGKKISRAAKPAKVTPLREDDDDDDEDELEDLEEVELI